MDLSNQTLGQFQIVEQVGKGGMATVYKAYQASLQRNVAIKVLSPKLADDVDLVKRFLREAQSAAALQHPGVIIIHDVGSEGDVHYIVTEFLEGMTLSQLLQQEGALPLDRILHISRQIANALDYAHSRGFTHRDIKPSNIMVDPARDDHVTLMDFGLVQVAGGSRITRTGFIMGTPDYMSPEQAKGDPIDCRTDVYSLGVTLYHMLTGEVPFTKSTPHAVLLAHIMEDPPSMAAADKEISFEIESVVRKAMAKSPADRYGWAGDLVADLEMAITSPAAFTAPPIRPSMYPQSPATEPAAVRPTPPPGPPEYGQTPPDRVTPYPQTPPMGVTPHRGSGGRKWIWPAVGLASFAALAAVVILTILFWPRLRGLMAGQPTPTVAAFVPTSTPEPRVEVFSVSPLEIQQGESVTIEWRVTGVDSIDIHPSVRENAPPTGLIEHKPGEDTVYALELPNGETREITVAVKRAAGAPVIELFEAEPPEQVRGREFKLAWNVTGDTDRIEISRGFEMIRGLADQDQLTLIADQTTTFILNAYNGELLSSKKLEFRVVDPTATPTDTPMPTSAPPTATPTVMPTATPTATSVPQAATSTATTAPKPVSTPTPKPASGVAISFEQFGTWKRGDQPYGELTPSQEQVKTGNYAGKLTYNFAGASAADDFVVFANQTSVAGEPNAISAWVYGDQSGHFLNIWIEDAKRQVWSVNLGTIAFSGWQQMSGPIDPARPWPSGKVFGPDNGVIDYPIRFYGLVLDRPGTGQQAGEIYLDDISFGQTAIGTEPGTSSTPGVVEPPVGEIGRIIFTVKVEEKRYSLYSTDPTWSKAVRIGETDWDHSTCVESNTVATALDGTTVGLRPIERCQIAGTVGSCPSPDGKYKVNTNNLGGRFSVVLFNVTENRIQEAYYEGKLNIYVGLNWAPDASHFLFTVDSSVYRGDVGNPGVHQVIPYKDPEWPLQYSADGSYVMYLKPVSGAISDVFVASPSGSNERNATNAPVSVKLCPRWRR